MKKVLILNYEFPPLGGGAGNATQHIARELAKEGYQVTVLTTWFTDLPEDTTVDGYRLIRVKSRRKRADRSSLLEMISYVAHAWRRSAQVVRQDRPDVVISFFAVPTGLVAWYLWKRFGIPYVVSLRGGDVPGFLQHELGLFHTLAAPFTHFIWKDAAHIVANSAGLQELAQKTAARYGKQVTYIPNGVDTDEFTPAETPPEKFTVLFAGRLTEQKGVTYILKAMHEIQQTEPDAYGDMKFLVVGDGPLRAALESEASALGIRDQVTFTGWVDRAALPGYFRKSTVLAAPSSEEGMPNMVLEALAAGLPVVATDIPGTNELVMHERNGLLITSPDEIAAALLRLYREAHLRQGFAHIARQEAFKHSWSAVARAYAALFV